MAKVTEVKHARPNDARFLIMCPACCYAHGFKVDGPEPRWSFNGDMEKPTLSPSLLVRSSKADSPTICHSFIREGMIQFLNDCTHDLKGQTVPLDDWDQEPTNDE